MGGERQTVPQRDWRRSVALFIYCSPRRGDPLPISEKPKSNLRPFPKCHLLGASSLCWISSLSLADGTPKNPRCCQIKPFMLDPAGYVGVPAGGWGLRGAFLTDHPVTAKARRWEGSGTLGNKVVSRETDNT